MKLRTNRRGVTLVEGNRVSRSCVPKQSLGTRRCGRRGFTLVEMLVATALVMFIMLILSEAFVAGLNAFRTLKGIGDMEERLRAAALIIRSDIELDHFEPGVRLSDVNFWRLGNPKHGFVNITQGFTPTRSNGVGVAAGPIQTVQVLPPPPGLPPLTVPDALNPGVAAWTIQPGSVLLVDLTYIPAGSSSPVAGTPEYVLVQAVNPANNTFTANFQLSHNTSFSIQFIRQYEGSDADGLPSSRATDHVLLMAVKAPGDRQENFFTGHMPYWLPFQPSPAYPLASPPGAPPGVVNPFFAICPSGLPNPNYVPTTFGDQPTDARFQDQLPSASTTIGYKTQWAEVAYFLYPNGEVAGGGTPLYALYRCEFKVVPDSRYLNGQVFGMSPSSPLPPPPLASTSAIALSQASAVAQYAALPVVWANDGFNEMSCQLGTTPLSAPFPANTLPYAFNTPSDLAGSNVSPGSAPSPSRAFTASITVPGPPPTSVSVRGPFNPSNPGTWSATLVATDVVSFDVQIAPGGAPASSGGILATSELPWANWSTWNPGVPIPPPLIPATPIIPAGGTNDFVDIPTGSFDTALTSNQYSINAVRIILRVWNDKTQQTRQVSIVQQF